MGWSISQIVIVVIVVIGVITTVVLTTTLVLLHPSNQPISVANVPGALITTRNITNCTVIYLTYSKEYYGTNTTLMAFDTQSRLFATVGPDIPYRVHQLIISPNNTLYGIARIYPKGFRLLVIDQSTAAVTQLCETLVQYDIYHGLPRIAMDSNGTFWLCGDGPDLLYTLDPFTCNTTVVASATLAFTYGGIINDTFYHGKTPEDLLYSQSLTPPYGVTLAGSVVNPVVYGLTSILFAHCPAPGDVRLQMGWQHKPSVVNFTSLNPLTGAPIPGTEFYVPLSSPQHSAWGISSSCWC